MPAPTQAGSLPSWDEEMPAPTQAGSLRSKEEGMESVGATPGARVGGSCLLAGHGIVCGIPALRGYA